MRAGKIALCFLVVALALTMGATTSNATITFASRITTPVAPVYQQTLNNPCIIGDPSCKEPADFDYTSRSGTPGLPGSIYTLASPSYLAQNVSGVIGNTGLNDVIPTSFQIGIDENTSSSGSGGDFEYLVSFLTYDCGTTNPSFAGAGTGGAALSTPPAAGCVLSVANSYQPGTPTPLPFVNGAQGNGYSDALLSGFALTSGHYYIFVAQISNDTDGMEEFFLIPSGSAPIPEPGTLVLFGSGMLGVAGFIRRKLMS